MRRAWMIPLLALLSTLFPPSAEAQVGPGGFMSANMTWVATIPIDSPGVGGRVVQVGDQLRLYVTGILGLSIYDVTNPAIPVPLGHTVLPNWENEDVSVADDGNMAIVGNDIFGYSYIIDTSVPAAPHIVGIFASTQHTITCADTHCDWAYGSYGEIFDLRDRAKPLRLARQWFDGLGITGSHDLNRDAAGHLVSDSRTRLMLDVSDPADPKLVASGPVPAEPRLAYQHNNIRPRADLWRPRAEGDTDPALRPGELLLAEGETNDTVTCHEGVGPFATWSMKDWDKGADMTPLHVFRPVNGNWLDGNPAVNVGLGCSGHWFTQRDAADGNILVAAGWYEHGTRVLKVDAATGAISQAAYFQPVVGSTSGAYWIGDTGYIYTVDYERGIDILKFDEASPVTTVAQNNASWFLVPHTSSHMAAEAERYACRLAMSA